MSHSTYRLWIIPAVSVLIGLSACSEFVNPNCADGGGEFSGYAVLLTVTDTEGRPAALGTTVRLIGSGIDEAVIVRSPEESLIPIGNDPGRFTIVVTRPWWVSQTIENVNVPAPSDHCGGLVPSRHDVVLELKPDAPTVRQVVAESDHIHVLSDPPFTGALPGSSGKTQLLAFVESDPGASSEIAWTPIPPDIGALTPDGVLTVRCRNSPIDTHVVATSTADSRVFTTVGVTVERTTLWSCPAPRPNASRLPTHPTRMREP